MYEITLMQASTPIQLPDGYYNIGFAEYSLAPEGEEGTVVNLRVAPEVRALTNKWDEVVIKIMLP